MKIVIIITWTPLPWSRSSLTFPFRIWGKSQFEWYRMWREWTCENFCENLHKVSCLRYSQLLELTSFDVGFYKHKKTTTKSLLLWLWWWWWCCSSPQQPQNHCCSLCQHCKQGPHCENSFSLIAPGQHLKCPILLTKQLHEENTH